MSEGNKVVDDRRYSKDHEWVRVEGEVAIVGISDHAQHALGDITFVQLPRKGRAVKQFVELAAVESAKAASDVFAPLSGMVAEVNAALENAPEKINQDPYGDGWICKIEGINRAELDKLLTAQQYRELLEKESQ